jgi:hypothetical protein
MVQGFFILERRLGCWVVVWVHGGLVCGNFVLGGY